MVKNVSIVLTLILSTSSYAQASAANTKFTAESLRTTLEQSQEERQTAANRLKASQADPKTLKLLTDREITFKLPNGTFVEGTLLETGKVAPAIRTASGLQPACVTSDFRLIPGEWDEKHKAIICHLEQSESFAILDNVAPQIAQSGTHDLSEENGITNQDPVTSEATQGGMADKYGPRKSPAELEKNGSADNGHSNSSASNRRPYGTDQQVNTESRTTSARKYGANNGTKADQSHSSSPTTYDPPPRNGSTSTAIAGVLSIDQKKFGISIGTWMTASLTRPVTSADSGQIEFVLNEDVPGRYRDLPAGTIFFANKSLNMGNRKLESMTISALLPSGEEINVQARIYSLDQTAGLSGTLVRDREGEFGNIASHAALSALSAATPEIDGAVGTAVGDVSQGLIKTEDRNVAKQPNAIIKVQQQRCLLKIAKTF